MTEPRDNPDRNQGTDPSTGVFRHLWEWVERLGFGNWLFGPRSIGGRGNRVQVYGCSPGCLLVMLALSVMLTLLVNTMLGWFT